MDFNPAVTEDRRQLAQRIIGLLLEAGFSEEAVPDTAPGRVFYRMIDGVPGARVQVCTTVVGRGDRAEVRLFDGNTILVRALYRTKLRFDRGIYSEVRIQRTGTVEDICERLLTTMRRSYGGARRVPKCERCGAPTFVSMKGNVVCADACFSRAPVQAQGDPA